MRMQTDNNLDLVVRQVSLLKSFSKVSAVLEGVAAFLWLPGHRQRFNGPRRIVGTRPLAVSVEVGQRGTLTFGVAKSRPVHGHLRYECIMKKDLTQPMTKDGRGSALCFGNDVMARRAINLLTALVRTGERLAMQPGAAKFAAPRHPSFLVPFPAGEEMIDQEKLAALATTPRGGLDSVETHKAQLLKELIVTPPKSLPGVSLVDSRIVPDACIAYAVERGLGYEDFKPVLGATHPNPVHRLREMFNPAAALLARHEIEDVGALDAATVDLLTEEFRAAVLLGERLTEEEIFDALCNPTAPLYCRKGVQEVDDARLILAMRRAAGNNRVAWEATDEDLLEAAFNPRAPLILSRLSATQVVAASDLAALPVPYSGNFLPELNWQPPLKKAALVA